MVLSTGAGIFQARPGTVRTLTGSPKRVTTMAWPGRDQHQAGAQDGGRHDQEGDQETAVARQQALAPVVMGRMVMMVVAVVMTVVVMVPERHRRDPGMGGRLGSSSSSSEP